MYFSDYNSPVGKITAVSEGGALNFLWIAGQDFYCDVLANCVKIDGLTIFKKAFAWLDDYFNGRNRPIDFMLNIDFLSPFRKNICQLLLKIPYGEVVTYGKIADNIERETGRRASAQAVGGAVGHNPISIIIPCHRVIGANNKLTGYAGGIDKKIALLTTEGHDLKKFK